MHLNVTQVDFRLSTSKTAETCHRHVTLQKHHWPLAPVQIRLPHNMETSNNLSARISVRLGYTYLQAMFLVEPWLVARTRATSPASPPSYASCSPRCTAATVLSARGKPASSWYWTRLEHGCHDADVSWDGLCISRVNRALSGPRQCPGK